MNQERTKLFLTIGLVLLGVIFFLPNSLVVATDPDTDPSDNIGSSLEEELERIERELAQLRKGKQDLNDQIAAQQQVAGVYSGEIGKLRGEMETLQIEIAEMELKVQELDVTIQMLEGEIDTAETDISENETAVESLQEETRVRIETEYMSYRARGRMNVEILPSKDPNTYFKDSQYNQLIQEETNIGIDELSALKAQLEYEKTQLEEKMVEMARSKAMLDEQYSQLDRAKEDIKSKIDGYYNALFKTQSSIQNAQNTLGAFSDQESVKMAEAERIRQQLFNSFSSIPAGQYVLAGTQIGNQGSTGWSTGPHLHFSTAYNGATYDPCRYLPANFVAGCGGNNTLQAPLRGSFYYTSRFYSGINGDLRCFPDGNCHAHPAIDVAHVIWNAPIYAAHDGWLIKGVDSYGANYIIICQDKYNCNSGFKTGYWHLSSF